MTSIASTKLGSSLIFCTDFSFRRVGRGRRVGRVSRKRKFEETGEFRKGGELREGKVWRVSREV
jgi:hypothetical protein